MEINPTTPLDYPQVEARDTFMDYHGTEVHDPYGWMVNVEDPVVQDWIAAQNALTDNWLEETANVAAAHRYFADRAREGYDFHRSLPEKYGDLYFWQERAPDGPQPKLYCAERPWDDETRKVVLDPQTFSGDNSLNIEKDDGITISPTGTHILYNLQKDGSEVNYTFLRDLRTGNDRFFTVANFGRQVWGHDGGGFYFWPDPFETDAFYCKLGSRGNDEMVSEWAGEINGQHEGSGQLAVSCMFMGKESDDNYLVYLVDRAEGTTKEILQDSKAQHRPKISGDQIYVITDYGVDTHQVVYTDINNATAPIEEWDTYLSADPEHYIEDIHLFDDVTAVEYIHNVSSKVELFDGKSGEQCGSFHIPPHSKLISLTRAEDGEDFYYSIESFLTPQTIYRYNMHDDSSEVIWQDKRSLDPEIFETRQEWYAAEDGTEIPMFIVGQKGQAVSADTPALLYGYGGWGLMMHPRFSQIERLLVENGGIAAIPNIRGGGEFGADWYRAGCRLNQPTSIDDFIQAAEYLVEQGYTSPDKLAISGGSNGGMLVAASLAKRPDLFKAAYSEVPVTDMIDFTEQLVGWYWQDEYGYTDEPEDFAVQHSISPYHNIKDGQIYPATFIRTGMQDSRVHPIHTFKLAARMQAANPVGLSLMRAVHNTGHFGDGNIDLKITKLTEAAAFLMHHLGVRIST